MSRRCAALLRAAIRGLLLLALLVSGAVAALPASPRPHSWVLDEAGLLDAAAEQRLDALIDAARLERPVELSVVTLADIGSEDPRRYATRLFNQWGIGDTQRHDGLLLFIAREQRAAEIILGQGIDDDSRLASSQRIMDQVLVPALRRGKAAQGIEASLRALLAEIHGLPGASQGVPEEALASPVQPLLEREDRGLPAAPGRSEPAAVRSERGPDWGALAMALGAPLALVAAFALRMGWRVRGRRCPRCAAPMQRLDEQADDAHLQPAQRIEESLRSVDYDVWVCTACSEVDIRRYGAWFRSVYSCPHCKARTLQRQTTTLQSATTLSGGRIRVDEHCAHCNHRHSHERSTPRLSSTSSSGRSRSGFSGGRSRGRGASGRW